MEGCKCLQEVVAAIAGLLLPVLLMLSLPLSLVDPLVLANCRNVWALTLTDLACTYAVGTCTAQPPQSVETEIANVRAPAMHVRYLCQAGQPNWED